jgi:zinc protease
VEVPDKANAVYYAALTVAMKDSDPDYPAVDVATYVFGGGSLSSRLGDRVRQKEGLSYGVGAQFHADAQDRVGRFGMVAICNPENMARLDRVIAEELERMLREGVGVKELEEAKKAYLQELKVNRATDAQLASLLQQELEAGRTLAYQADLEKKIAALTPEQVATAFRKHIAAKRLVIIHAGSLKK